MKNDWHFSIRGTPPADVLWIVNPGSRFVHVASVAAPPELWAALDAEGRAALITPMLLNTFVSRMERPDGKHVPSFKAPWRWATNNAAVATEVEKTSLLKSVSGRIYRLWTSTMKSTMELPRLNGISSPQMFKGEMRQQSSQHQRAGAELDT